MQLLEANCVDERVVARGDSMNHSGLLRLALAIVIGVSAANEVGAAPKTKDLSRGSSMSCQHYVGQVIEPKTFDAAVAAYAAIPSKSEFETTAQFQARKAAALANVEAGDLIVALNPTDRKYFQYDADAQVLRIIRYAFDNVSFAAWEAFYSAGLYNKIPVSTAFNIDLVVSQEDRETGTYEASNAYGAKAQILKIDRTSKVIFQRAARSYDDQLFPSANKEPYSVGQLQLSPEQAIALKPGLKLAISVSPKEPFFVSGTHKPGKTTLQNPRDISEHFSVLFADFKCGLVTDAENKVLGAYPAQ